MVEILVRNVKRLMFRRNSLPKNYFYFILKGFEVDLCGIKRTEKNTKVK